MLYGFSMDMFLVILFSALGVVIIGYLIGILTWYQGVRTKSTSEDVQDVSTDKQPKVHKAA